MKREIFVVISSKGGCGKSVICGHFLLAYLQRKKEREVKIYEFDGHNYSFGNISNDPNVKGSKVLQSSDDISRAFSNIEWEFEEGVPIIIDVGGSDNVDRFFEAIEGKTYAEDIVYIVPETKGLPSNSIDAIVRIQTIAKNAGIVMALNMCNDVERYKEEYFFLFGSKKRKVLPHEITKEPIAFTPIPECANALTFSLLKRVSLWEYAKLYRKFKDSSISEKKLAYAKFEKGDTWKDGDKCSHEFYIDFEADVNNSQLASDALMQAERFFLTLDELTERK